jgi:endonuclease YncB( thermonuclease family)
MTKGVAVLAWIGLIAVLSMLPGCGRGGLRFADQPSDQLEEIEALDGGTVLIDGEPYRLAGISAPRPAPKAACWAEALLAHEARQALALALMRKVEIGPDEGDPPGVIRLVVDGRSLSRDLVEQGLAASTAGSWDWCGPVDLSAPNAPRLNLRAAHP